MPTVGKRMEIKREKEENIEVILYEPEEKKEELPVYIYLHGGAWIAGDAIQIKFVTTVWFILLIYL